MQDLDQALGYLLEEEGGWSDHPNDRGGKTMWGVTQATYNAYRKKTGKPSQSVKLITKEECRELYRSEYWNAAGCDKLPWPISYITFDAAVNSGASRSLRWTQAGLGMKADGIVGPQTVSAAKAVIDSSDGSKILAILDQRVQFLTALVKKDTTQLVFLLGWWRRTMRVLGRALLSELEA